MSIKDFIERNYHNFNAQALNSAAKAYQQHLDSNGKMFVTLAGAMSTAQIGISLAEMIRQDKVHAICCTGANLEEDFYNLISNKDYKKIPNYRNLSGEEELALWDNGYSRVTDTAIPRNTMEILSESVLPLWKKAEESQLSYFPHEYLYQLIQQKTLEKFYQTDPKRSWLIAAYEKQLPIFVPGWEDSTLGNFFIAKKIEGELKTFETVKNGFHQMEELASWYELQCSKNSIGFFQIGGGIAGDFPICVVPMIKVDLHKNVKSWGYFCQISDSTTSYGSYSGAIPNEKITWGKIDVDTPQFIIESDASIVAPLIFSYLLGH